MSHGRALITILLVSLVLGISMWTIFDRDYSAKMDKIESFLVPNLDTTDFVGFNSQYNYCPTDLKYDVYKLQEKFFKDTEELTINTVIHYFPNSNSSVLDDSIFYTRVKLMNDFFRGSGANIVFSLDTVITHSGTPSSDPAMLKSIVNFESFLGKKRIDLRNRYYGDHVDFHNNVFEHQNALNIYVYNDDTHFSGRAGDIESTYFAVNLKFMHPELYTFEHEAGHCYGLYHTHALDNSGERHSTDGGDFICETNVTFPLNSIVSDSCELVSNWRDHVQLPTYSNPISSWDNIEPGEVEMLIKNVMSYTRHQCRQEFTPEQIKRMRKILENNRDLRATIKGLDTDIKSNLLRSLAEIH